MAINDYYGHKAGTTYLQVFTEPLDGSERIIHRSLQDSEAYDTWHLSYYFKEVLEYKRLLRRQTIDFDAIPRKEKNLLLYLLLAAAPELRSVMEIGSSLYEMIDGFEVVQKYIRDTKSPLPLLDIEAIEYKGIELSEMLRLTSEVLHPDYTMKLYNTASDFTDSADLLYDRSVTNYAYENVDELVDFVKRGRVALLNTYFSLGDTFQTSRLGKTLTYFSLDEFMSKIDKPFCHLFGTRAPGPFSGQDIGGGNDARIEGFFLYGDQPVIDRFMEISHLDKNVARYFQQKEIIPKDPESVEVPCLAA